MLLKKSSYKDVVSDTTYNLTNDMTAGKKYIITGENGVGKSRFLEGVFLKNIKKSGFKMLYFSQDIENQILSFELISLVKEFVYNLKKTGSFFKTIFLNDDAHQDIQLDFNEKETLHPDNDSIRRFILRESEKFNDVDILILDEVDKFFNSTDEFRNFIRNSSIKSIVIISHILGETLDTVPGLISVDLNRSGKGVTVEFLNN